MIFWPELSWWRPRMRFVMLGLCAAVWNGSVPRGTAEPTASTISIRDSLRDGSVTATEISGGAFGSEGWKVTEPTDYLRYELPEGVLSGSVEFEVKGVRMGMEGDARKHVLGISDRYLGARADYNSTNSTVIMLRVWTKDRETSKAGKTRLRTIGLGYGPPDTKGSKFQTDSPPLEWEVGRWYRLRVRWTQTETVFERDGVEISQVAYPDRGVSFRHVFLNLGYYAHGLHGLSDVVFRNVQILAERPPGRAPVRDARPEATAPSTASGPVVDQPVPGGEGGGMTVHVAAGTHDRDFHVTFERNGISYMYFDGATWSAAVKLGDDTPFRSGVHIAVDRDNAAHLAWGDGPHNRNGTIHYQTVRDGVPGPVEDVHGPQDWNECDIAVDDQGRPVIAAGTSQPGEIAVYEREEGGWRQTVLPSDNTHNKWAPSITFANGGLLFVAFRRKDRHPFTWQVRDGGVWAKDQATPWRSYEPNLIPTGSGIIGSSNDGYVYMVEKQDGQFVVDHRNVREIKRGPTRGQHVGVGLTTKGTLVLFHSDMRNEDTADRTVQPRFRAYYSHSSDHGQTWTFNQPVSAEPGQGHGNMAVNGEWILMVWPDIRGGMHLRHTLMPDRFGAEPVSTSQ